MFLVEPRARRPSALGAVIAVGRASHSRHRAHVERSAVGPGASGPARGFKFRLGSRVSGLGAALRGRSRTTRTMATPTHPFRCDVFRILPPGLLWTGGPLTISATSCTHSKRFLTIAWPFASVLLPLSYFQSKFQSTSFSDLFDQRQLA